MNNPVNTPINNPVNNPLYDTLFGPHAGRDTPFIRLPDGGIISHADFLAKTARMAGALTGPGLELAKGDRVCIRVEKSVDAISIYAACAQAGLVFLPLNTAYTPDEVAYFLADSGARVFVCDDAAADSLAPVAARTGAVLHTLNADGSGTLTALADTRPDTFETVAASGGDLAALLYTSGTTGRSKGAMLTQDNLTSNALTLAGHWHFTADDVLLHALPVFHTHGLFVAINVILASGGSMILMPKFDAAAVIRHLPDATALMGVPTFYTRLLAEDAFDRALVKNMRLFISGSAPLLAETHRRFHARTGHRILERYGMTETNMNTSNPYEGERLAGTVGLPLPGVEVRVCDPETGAPVPPGQTGVLEVRGPNVFKGYWKMPEKTAEELRPDGFFITGDLASIDAAGYITIIGRNKDLVISGGFNIYPKELELILDEQDGVLESAVIGVPHPDFGESPVAVLVPDGRKDPDPARIGEALKSALAGFKQPRKLIFTDTLPRNTMGKVQKNVLRETYKGLFDGALKPD